MLRISYSQTSTEQRWTICGQLAGPWVQEFRSFWRDTRHPEAELTAIVDLTDVTFVDEDGECLLGEMRSADVEFIATDVETKHLLENLKPTGERTLRRLAWKQEERTR